MTAEAAGTPGRGFWRRFLRHRPAALSAAFLAMLVALLAAMTPIGAMTGLDTTSMDLAARLAGPGGNHPLGTDELGRDLMMRLLEGGRVSLAVGFAGALLAALIGLVVGLAAGFAGGAADALLMRLTDAVIALPLLPLLVVLAAVDPARLGLPAELAGGELASVLRIVVIVALFGWTTVARLVRASVLRVRRLDYVRAAQALGAGPLRVVLRHVLPNVAGPAIVATTLSIGNVILAESVLSFLGLGIQPPLASWGNMLTNAQELIWQAPFLAVWPGLLIFLTVMACNFLGDGLQDALDPRDPEPAFSIRETPRCRTASAT
ncbi:ABC transporter permease [Geminicoccaceae bacterium 1502E]|nr:ABC transporter permease [Geminicoccaceae bacterium 1502E]